MRTKNLAGRCALASILALAAIGWTSPLHAQDSLRAGVFELPPWGGETGGFCTDLLDAISDRTGLQFEFVQTAVGDLMPTIAAGEVDVECSGFSPNNARRGLGIWFTSSHATSDETVVVRVDNATTVTTVADLSGGIVGSMNGIGLYIGLVEAAGFEDIPLFPNAILGLQAVVDGDITALVVNGPVFRYQQLQGMWPELKRAEGYASVFVSPAALAVRAGNVELLGQLQATLEELKLDGTIDELAAKWAVGPPPF